MNRAVHVTQDQKIICVDFKKRLELIWSPRCGPVDLRFDLFLLPYPLGTVPFDCGLAFLRAIRWNSTKAYRSIADFTNPWVHSVPSALIVKGMRANAMALAVN